MVYPTSMNRCNLPSWAIASKHYNSHPQTIEIQGVSHNGRPLFEKLETEEDPDKRGLVFHDFMDVRYQLHQWQREETKNSRKSLKNSYLRFLRGWLFDSNSVEGAVLKGWVESRLGLPPTLKGSERTSAIMPQFDLLYEFVQYELSRRFSARTHLKLYRGIYDFDEHQVIEKYGKNRYLLRLNNLNSFTDDFERAWEFGSRVLEVDVPITKIFFMGGLLPKSLFKGEGEVLVIGGEFEVKVLIGG
jgi:NAD+--dinitrogen-reductase ADP-D-ribosyltransferase